MTQLYSGVIRYKMLLCISCVLSFLKVLLLQTDVTPASTRTVLTVHANVTIHTDGSPQPLKKTKTKTHLCPHQFILPTIRE